MLYKNGTDITACDLKGRSTLHLAAGFGNEDAIQWLVNLPEYEDHLHAVTHCG